MVSTVWIPNVIASSDGQPLATTIADLWVTNFAYDRLPVDNSTVVAFFLRPECVLACLIAYNTTKGSIKKFAKLHVDPKAIWFRNFVAVHNLALAIFSGVVAWNVLQISVAHAWHHGLQSTSCDDVLPNATGQLWQAEGLGSWAIIFYLSKYYEFMDTWILLLKGKEASLLQVYHHTGVAACFWIGVVSQSAWLFYAVSLNSIIHTFMYTYFFVKTLYPTLQIKAAKYLTMAQIGQFVSGILFAIRILLYPEGCGSVSSRFGLISLQVYGTGLIVVFSQFAKKKYSKAE